MALNFPDSPTLNQIYTDTTSGFSYQWDGVVWQSYSAPASKNISILDDISGSFDGLTNSFPITINGSAFTPANAQQLRIVLGGIVQQPLVDYVVSGSNIAFTTPPSSGLTFSGVSLGPAVAAVGVGSTGTFYTRQSYTVSGTQSSFTVTAGYDIGYLDVYQNGVRLLVGVDYTASDGTGFTLTTAAQDGDIVEAISYKTTTYYSLNGVLNDLIVSGNASIGGNTYISGITTVVGSLNVIGGGNFSTSGIGTFGNLDVSGGVNFTDLNVSGVTTLGNKVKVGVGTTALIVEGDARITGILTIGTSSITLDGTNNEIKIGTGVTISSTGITGSASTVTSAATAYGLSGTPDLIVGVTTASRLSVGGSITELSQGQYWNVVTQADVGIGASQVPLNQYLGQLAFLDEFGTNIPQNAQTGAYTLVRADSGKHISITTGGVTVPAGVFEIGDNIMIYNNSTSAQTITQGGSVTLRLSGSASTGNRTLSQYGVATILCVASNTFVISGSGLS